MEEAQPSKRQHTELAKAFATAYISVNTGTSYATTKKNYVDKTEDVGEMWHYLADIAVEMAMVISDHRAKQMKS